MRNESISSTLDFHYESRFLVLKQKYLLGLEIFIKETVQTQPNQHTWVFSCMVALYYLPFTNRFRNEMRIAWTNLSTLSKSLRDNPEAVAEEMNEIYNCAVRVV